MNNLSKTSLNNSGFVSLESLFQAYFDCRRNKRGTMNAMAFEADYESNLTALCHELNSGNYLPGRSIAFIVDRPVKREIFAADFRDRVVHHWLINRLNPLFEKLFIYDSYACRKGRGTHFGIERAARFIRQCSQNYTHDCSVLKLDIQGFFMAIDRALLMHRLKAFIHERYHEQDQALVLDLCHKILNYEPTKNCILKGGKSRWNGLPPDKSLFHSNPNCGLPIGNLTIPTTMLQTN